MGTLTISTTTAQDTRIVVAFGAYLGYGRNATGPEVKAAIIQMIRDVVTAQETFAQQRSISVAPMDPT